MKLLDFDQTKTITTNGAEGEDSYTIRAVPSPDDLRAVNAYRMLAANAGLRSDALRDRITQQGPADSAELDAVFDEIAAVEARKFDLIRRFLESWSHETPVDAASVERLHQDDQNAILRGIIEVADAMRGVQADPKEPSPSSD